MRTREGLYSPVVGLDQYQALAMATRREDHSSDWREVYPDQIHDELLELIAQHGVGLAVLMPKEFAQAVSESGIVKTQPDLQSGMIEEVGDLLWFAATTASYSGYKLSDLCKIALNTAADIGSFSDLDAAVLCYPERISVLNEFGVSYAELDPEYGRERVDDDPFYLLIRTCRRLTRSIDPSGRNISPSIYPGELPAPLPEAIADFVNVLAYIANNRLGVSLAKAAQFNIDKLQARAS